ncbi:RelA/SpoT family protein [Aestuariivirga litoralis]|uniref:RelA/SpoT family protein n=1 Tax=Aestuariivirga litoralis TaxID=2650924 RepID=UPI0018C75CC9|nr:bifunctional (p)ppGpp synthetase/guanosine-3',5'-bis(diphosphate) 3'-pyrophosphohydrolase [Aestuariivirga litoralis]MBG1231299.1 bifunctional (p)ppGpp synthetase/guanosine-3',5'-bis(diphosphate) 3'-pyrophosphohydrolase [Aestuariivirga litoralis]
MMRQYELVERVIRYDPQADEDLLNRAYVYAMKAHGNQKRASGEAYFNHPLEVAAILTDMKLDSATIAAALLHDTVEDTEATAQEIADKFGFEIASLVDGLTKIAKLDMVTKEATQAENLRKLLLAMSRDVRVLLVKLADRLHNMRTLQFVKPEKRRRIAQETMEIYAPLAGRMGMQLVREEMEDLAFAVLNPEASKLIVERLARLHSESGGLLQEIENTLSKALGDHGIKAEVKGREKRAYSIFAKMERSNLSLDQLSDVFGFRVLVDTIDDCYRALGVVHQKWLIVPGRFKDYISSPKQNDYRSIHTIVIGPHSQRVEVQIRTHAMHEIAERGVAAHALYKDVREAKLAKEGVRIPASESSAYRWLRRLMETLQEGDSPKEFLEHTRLELFYDQIFCFTPKGKLIALPRGATPIDFAYALHTSIGDSCVGCKVNGRTVALVTKLQNGDEVVIIRSDAATPPPAWEAIVVTGKAKAAIRRATRADIRKQYAGIGRELVEKLLARQKKTFNEKEAAAAVPRLGHRNLDDALAAIGRGDLSAGDLLKALGLEVDDKDLRAVRRRATAKEDSAFSVPVRGAAANMALKIFNVTGAVPGERIVGIVTPGEGITIYPIFAAALEQFDQEPERWVDLAWGVAEEGRRFPARISITLANEVGALAQVTQVIGDHGGNIDELNLHARHGVRDFFDLVILLEVFDIRHLNEIMNELKAKPLVSDVNRVTE